MTLAIGTIERLAALAMHEGVSREEERGVILAVNRAYDAADFVMDMRELNATPYIAENTAGHRSTIDGRTARHPGSAAP